ncbi:MAG: hypothetical protein IPK82_06085 [Polyangiaceae bacterium]|nr:hypothetical protein [Polyangiaceae bacterium]
MLGSYRSQVALAIALGALFTVGCDGDTTQTTSGTGGQGGETTSTSTTGGSGGTTTSTSSTGGTGGGLTCENNEGVVLAVTSLSFGEGDSGQWKSVGYNLDGLETTAVSKDVCQPNSGAATSTPYPDGDMGIDNSFGKNLVPLILSLYPTWVDDVNNGIQKGIFTSLLKLDCVPPTGDVPSFTSRLYGATDLGTAPKFDGTDQWPVAPELLSDPNDPFSSTVIFAGSSIKDNLYDSGPNQTYILTVPLKTQTQTTSIKLTLYAARTTMTLAEDRKSATSGTIGGVVNTEDVVAEVKKIGALLDLCDTAILDSMLSQVRQASDIMADGTQDPNQTCDGISIGLKFEMKEAQIGSVGPASPVGDSCL